MVSSFSTKIRYTAVAIGYNIAQAAYAGTAPVLASYLEETTKSVIPAALWVSCVALIAAITVSILRGRSEFEELESELAAARKERRETLNKQKGASQSSEDPNEQQALISTRSNNSSESATTV